MTNAVLGTIISAYVVKGVVRALFEAANKSADPGVYIVKGSVKKLF